MLHSLFFILLSGSAIVLFVVHLSKIFNVIRIGRADSRNPLSVSQRIGNVCLFALGQKKMFHKPIVALLHLIVYIGFFVVNIELVEIFIDGITGKHRSLIYLLDQSTYYFAVNTYEVIAVSVIVACVLFLWRRSITKIRRLSSSDISGFPKRDGNIILLAEILLMLFFLTMNAAEYAAVKKGTGNYTYQLPQPFLCSQLLSSALQSLPATALYYIERTSWWLHLLGILAFLNYLPYSKHLHILLGFITAYRYQPTPMGKLANMPDVEREVEAMIEEKEAIETNEPLYMGASDIFQLSKRNLLDAFSCSECGRCSDACPAHITGKKLSPRKVMMAVRDRAEKVMHKAAKVPNKKEQLLHNYISEEELRACTTCQACISACPLLLNPLDIIMQLRRSLIMEQTSMPNEWMDIFTNIENNHSPWKYPHHERATWAKQVL